MTDQEKKEALADVLRRYPHFGDAYLAALETVNDMWGSLLAYYTDIPEAEVQRLIGVCERTMGGSRTDPAAAICANCGHSRDLHEKTHGYKPYGWCNFQHDLCGCREFRDPAAHSPDVDTLAHETWWSLTHMSYTGDQPDLRKQDVEEIASLIRDLAFRARRVAKLEAALRKVAESIESWNTLAGDGGGA